MPCSNWLTLVLIQTGPKTQVIDSVATFIQLLIGMVLFALLSIGLLIMTLWIDNSTAWLKTRRTYATFAVWLGPLLTAAMVAMAGHMAWKVFIVSPGDSMPIKVLLFFVLYCTLGPVIGLVSTLFAFRFRKRLNA